MSRGSSATKMQSVQAAKKQLQQFLKSLDRIPTEVLEEERPILYSEILAEVPYRTGKLEKSVKVTVAKDKRRPGLNASASARSASGYNYAGIQHENEHFQHPIKGKAYYISDPFERCIKRIRKKMQKRLKLPKR